MSKPKICNLCGGTDWRDKANRVAVECAQCGSLERTRAVKLVLEALGLPEKGSRILHLAPERGLAPWLRSVSPDGYDPVDVDPSLYSHVKPRKLDLLVEADQLATNSYDLILHLHVLEHVPCNIAPILFHLHRALKPDGFHVFCIPIKHGRFYEEDLKPLSREEAESRFFQHDHVRVFGSLDLGRSIGSIIRIPDDYSLYRFATADLIERSNIPENQRTGLQGSTIFVVRKSDYRLGYPQ